MHLYSYNSILLLTLSALGLRVASLNNSEDAMCVRLRTKSSDGPISSSSTLGVLVPDFLRAILMEGMKENEVGK